MSVWALDASPDGPAVVVAAGTLVDSAVFVLDVPLEPLGVLRQPLAVAIVATARNVAFMLVRRLMSHPFQRSMFRTCWILSRTRERYSGSVV